MNKHVAYDIGIASLTFFALGTVFAMLIYPGGTNINPDTIGYAFSENFFSDLGRYKTFANEPKLMSMALFSSSLIFASIGLILYFLNAPLIFGRTHKKLVKLGSGLGIVSSLCFAGVALTPWDLYGDMHLIFVKSAFLTFLLTVVLYGIAVYRSKVAPIYLAMTYGAHALVVIFYLYLLFWGPAADTADGLFIQTVGQKIVVYSQIFCMLIQTVWARSHCLKSEL